MHDIKLPFTIGDRQAEVILSSPLGASGGYHIMIDKYLHGTVNKMTDGWHVYLNENSFLTAEDSEVILEAVRKRE